MDRRGCMVVCAFVAIVYLSGCVFGQVASLCRPNERYLACGCPKTCKDPAPNCSGVCRTGCFCEDDEVRNETGHCVKLAECPPVDPTTLITTEPRSSEQCPDDEEYRFCEPCNKTCDTTICPAQCARGCFCKGDLVRAKDGRCVKVEECPSHEKKQDEHQTTENISPKPYKIVCGAHQFYNECQLCENTCGSPRPACRDVCSAGCYCEQGFYKSPNGQCVKLEECPLAEILVGGAHEPTVEDCSSDEIYLSCGWCEPSCWDPHPKCPVGVCTRGCLCRPPLLRHHSGHCVEEHRCTPQRCVDPNEEFVCRYGCEASCEPRDCPERPRRCALGCHCKLGLYRDPVGRCVVPEQCPQNPTNAEANRTDSSPLTSLSSTFKGISFAPRTHVDSSLFKPLSEIDLTVYEDDSNRTLELGGKNITNIRAVKNFKDLFNYNPRYRDTDFGAIFDVYPKASKDIIFIPKGINEGSNMQKVSQDQLASMPYNFFNINDYLNDFFNAMKEMLPDAPMNLTIIKYPF